MAYEGKPLNGTSLIFKDGFWQPLSSLRPLVILGSSRTTQQTGFETVAGFEFNPSDYYGYTTYTLRLLLETTNASDGAEARLYNVTTDAAVTSSVLNTISIETVLLTSDVTADIASGSNIYDFQIRLQTTGSPNTCICKHAELRLS